MKSQLSQRVAGAVSARCRPSVSQSVEYILTFEISEHAMQPSCLRHASDAS